jgi:flagellar biosynthesis/type III secretory pathway chaperone
MPRPRTNPAALRRILQQELAVGKRLADLAEEESDAIIHQNLVRMLALQEEQKECLQQQELLEVARLNATRDLAWGLGMDRVQTLAELLPGLPARDQDALQRLRTQLLETAGRLKMIDRRNRVLLEEAMHFIRFSLDTLTQAALQPPRYGSNMAVISTPAFYVDSKA